MGGGASHLKAEELAPQEKKDGELGIGINKSKSMLKNQGFPKRVQPEVRHHQSITLKHSDGVHSNKAFAELEAIQKRDPYQLLSSAKYDLMTREDRKAQHGTADNSFVIVERSENSCLFSRLKLNCAFSLFEYLAEDLLVCLSVCKTWNRDLKTILSSKCGHIAAKFTNSYHQHIRVCSANISITRPKGLTGWYRINYEMRCRAMPSLQGQHVILCHQFRYYNRPEKVHYTSHRFDCLRKEEARCIWVLREENRSVAVPRVNRAMPVLQIRPSDEFIINVSIWSGEGLLNQSHFDWLPLGLYPRSTLYTYPDNLIDSHFDDMRSSEVELQAKWRKGSGDPARKLLSEEYFSPNFKRVSASSSGLDLIYLKGIFRAIKEGRSC
jgi:hypothetical protein